MSHTLTAKGITKRYQNRTVVNQFDFSVKTSEVIGLLGPNGAGKTTSFYIMVGLIQADLGKIFLDDTDITDLPLHQRARLGISYLPQEASIFRKLSAQDNIMAALELQPHLTAAEREETLQRLLDEFHLHTVQDTLGFRLSGGERRRVEIARALATKPKFILLDEPFAGVDPISIHEVKSLIRTLCAQNIGVVITDHNVRETLDICDRAVILYQGTMLAEGTPTTILQSEEVRRVYLGDNF